MIKAITKKEALLSNNVPLENVLDEVVNIVNNFIALKNYTWESDEAFTINLYLVCNKLNYNWEILTEFFMERIQQRYINSGWNCVAGDLYSGGPYKGIWFYK